MFVQHDIFQLEIIVYDRSVVHVLQRHDNLRAILLRYVCSESAANAEVMKEFTSAEKRVHKMQLSLQLECRFQFYNEWVVRDLFEHLLLSHGMHDMWWKCFCAGSAPGVTGVAQMVWDKNFDRQPFR